MIQFSERLDADKILQLLSKALPYYLTSWNDQDDNTGLFGSVDPRHFNMRKVGSSSPVIEYVIRPHLHILCILAAYLGRRPHGDGVFSLSREQLIDKVNKGLRWICETHLTGTRDVESFLERKRWGENWRSGLWATLAAICAYFAGEDLDEAVAKRVREVLAFEADRFINVVPPSGCRMDTKLEENAEDTMMIAWAINMVPNHPHKPAWEKVLSIWALNIATCIRDRADHTEYLGRSVSYWTTTQTLYPDMTAENHGFFHPEILTYGLWVILAMASYRLHGREIPSFFHRRNHQEAFNVLLRFSLPTGLTYAPAGTDLPMFLPRPLGLAWGLWNNDPSALRMTTKLLAWMDGLREHPSAVEVPWVRGFDAHHEGWELLFQTQPGFELAMLAVLPFPDEHRFYSLGQLESAVDTRENYSYVEVCYRRNTRTSRSIAWKALGRHPVIGIAIHSYPTLVAISRASGLGIPKIGEQIKYAEVAFHTDRPQRDGFDTAGRIHYFGANRTCLLRRDVRVITWGDDGLVVLDTIIAEKNVAFEEQYLSPIYLVNDFPTGGQLQLAGGSLRENVRADNTRPRPLNCPSFWASIESHLLFQFLWGRTKGLTYIPAAGPNAPRYWKNCRFDMLAVHMEAKHCAAGETAYAVGFYLGAGKGPRPFKSAGTPGEFFKGLVIMDGKNTIGLD
ncbi:MAG: hypothetical protein GF344_10255 [Chitinivibrionales bacterium]|nr:hypothetical protein [Chitinivibrionales bacterium]MBD3357211.1 hypothetical protein [Chitinivibrionales bacterium]